LACVQVGGGLLLGGGVHGQSHDEWLITVASSPDIISMSSMPVTSLLA
jgi:hypothetical protein